jgi:aminoglycoside phosphotransferase (APT) family kinase protein
VSDDIGAAPGLDPLIDPEALTAYLDARFGDTRPLQIERHQAGHSNETFFVTRGDARWVLRRPPRPPYLPTAHDVAREHTVISGLSKVGVRVPGPVLLCTDTEIIGAPFFLMERVDGIVIRDRVPAELDVPAERRRISEEFVDAMAELHTASVDDAGLTDFGKPTGYIARQIQRWRLQLEGATKFTRPVPDLDRVAAWLADNQPVEQPASIVQGDFKLDNVIYAPGAPARLAAILDWEMATRGDPLADLGYALSFWREAGDDADPLHGSLGDVFSGDGWLSRRELIERYTRATGREVGDLTFYVTLAVWKLAVLLEGSYARHLMGTTDDPFFAALEQGVPAIAARAVAISRSGL